MNNDEIWDAIEVKKFLLGIKCPCFAEGKDFMTDSDDHKNDFVKTTAYLASFVQHGKGRRSKYL